MFMGKIFILKGEVQMIIVMKPGATEDNLSRVKEKIEKAGGKAEVV